MVVRREDVEVGGHSMICEKNFFLPFQVPVGTGKIWDRRWTSDQTPTSFLAQVSFNGFRDTYCTCPHRLAAVIANLLLQVLVGDEVSLFFSLMTEPLIRDLFRA
jgi:hypothetical protein